MKELFVVSLLVVGAIAQYEASGWRPSGPAFELPQKERPQSQQPQQYLPPVDPRNPARPPPQYPEEDVSVQGLPPAQEQQPLFQASPVSGQQYTGPSFSNDLRNLDKSFQQSQYEEQQQRYKEYQRQKQLEAAQSNINGNRLPNPQGPRQFARTTTTEIPTTESSTTELSLNQGEVLNGPVSEKNREKVSVEVTKQNVQEYPGELFLNGLAQLQLRPQFVPLQISGAYRLPSQKQVAEFDAATHFSALPSVLAQQNQLPQSYQNPLLIQQNEPVLVQQPVAQFQPTYQPQIQTQFQPDPVVLQAPAQFQPNIYGQPNTNVVSVQQPAYQPQATFPQFQQTNPDAVSINQPSTFQLQGPQTQFQPQPNPDAVSINQASTFQPQPQGSFPQFQAQPVLIPRQNFDPQSENQNPKESADQQQIYQQPIIVQPYQVQNQIASQNQYLQPEIQYLGPQEQQYQNQIAFPNQYQKPDIQYLRPQEQQYQGQETLQSGLDINQDGNNDIDQQNDDDPDQATAVATAFGSRTQPRVNTRYGAPFPVPRVQANPGYSTTESAVEEVTEEGPAVAEAVAVANGDRRKNARLRSRRVRPVYAVDTTGRLVLAEA